MIRSRRGERHRHSLPSCRRDGATRLVFGEWNSDSSYFVPSLGTRYLAAQHGQLMPQHEDLELLELLRARA
jgi:hypothetical protein